MTASSEVGKTFAEKILMEHAVCGDPGRFGRGEELHCSKSGHADILDEKHRKDLVLCSVPSFKGTWWVPW
jgi:hypothetical protein